MIDRAVLLGLQAATLAARGAVALRSAIGSRHARPPAEGPLRILMVAHYPAANAGTRYRLLHWAERLRGAGHEVDVALPTGSARGERLYRTWTLAARAEYHLRLLARRVGTVGDAGGYHVAVLHLSDLPHWEYGAPFVARALVKRAGRLLLDLDDLPVIRGETGPPPRAHELARVADGLLLGNDELRRHFAEGPGWRLPTCIEPGDWAIPDRRARSGPPVLGWIGTSGRLGPLEALAPVLARVQAATGARVRVICDRAPELPGVQVEHVPWSLEGEVEAVVGLDVGLAPLEDGPMERCKCGLKVLQYMAAGLPVVASPVGVLGAMVEDGVSGRLVPDLRAWEAPLIALVEDREARLAAGSAGRLAAQADWSFERHLPTLDSALRGGASTW